MEIKIKIADGLKVGKGSWTKAKYNTLSNHPATSEQSRNRTTRKKEHLSRKRGKEETQGARLVMNKSFQNEEEKSDGY